MLGGILRGTTFLHLGTDLGIALRGATGGFARGQWGVALDLGVVGRWWRQFDYGEYPFRVVATDALDHVIERAHDGEDV